MKSARMCVESCVNSDWNAKYSARNYSIVLLVVRGPWMHVNWVRGENTPQPDRYIGPSSVKGEFTQRPVHDHVGMTAPPGGGNPDFMVSRQSIGFTSGKFGIISHRLT